MMIFAYVGPEVVLPLASVVAAAFGFVMMVGRAPFRLAARWLRAARTVGRKEAPAPVAGRRRLLQRPPDEAAPVEPSSISQHISTRGRWRWHAPRRR